MVLSSALTFQVAKKSKGCRLLKGGLEGERRKLNVVNKLYLQKINNCVCEKNDLGRLYTKLTEWIFYCQLL